MAHLSADPGLMKAFRRARTCTAPPLREVFEVDVEEVSGDQRRKAKAINFGLIYGMSAFGLARQLHLGRNEAQQYIERYFERYPGVQQYMDRTRAVARSRVTLKPCLVAGCTCRRSTPATKCWHRRRSARRSMPRCRYRRGHYQAGHAGGG